MRTQIFEVKKPQMLSVFIKANIFGAGFVFVKKLLKNKDIKINSVRVGNDTALNVGDTVQVFYKEDSIREWTPYRIVFEDENIVVVFKNRGIETTSEENMNTLEALLSSNSADCRYTAVHRLDVNTEGLVVFAKTEMAATELKNAFEQGWVKKTYIALCFGRLQKSPLTITGYLTKDKELGEVTIVKDRTPGAVAVKTILEFIRLKGDFSVIKISPITGRTHQIRAHLATIGLYIVGDGKYGNAKMNKVYAEHKQCLCATEIKFAFPSPSPMCYLNDKEFVAKPSFL
jgi:23S rRNA pseudouridine955/2504/2580 synthase